MMKIYSKIWWNLSISYNSINYNFKSKKIIDLIYVWLKMIKIFFSISGKANIGGHKGTTNTTYNIRKYFILRYWT